MKLCCCYSLGMMQMQSQATATLAPVFPGWSGLSSSQPRPLEATGWVEMTTLLEKVVSFFAVGTRMSGSPSRSFR